MVVLDQCTAEYIAPAAPIPAIVSTRGDLCMISALAPRTRWSIEIGYLTVVRGPCLTTAQEVRKMPALEGAKYYNGATNDRVTGPGDCQGVCKV